MNLFAYTAPDEAFPGYVSINRMPNGDVVVTVRSAPTTGQGPRICRHGKDAGPYDCTPGGPHCNNYCNMAPEKGPMQDSPETVEWARPGAVVDFVIPAKDWTLK